MSMKDLPPVYSRSRFIPLRRISRVVRIGSVAIGGKNPIAVQSMTNTPTQAVEATVAQATTLASAGCRIVRVTAPNMAAAQALADIRRDFTAAGFGDVPLVADIHFLPEAAMEAALHVEKIRINPGNYADRKLSRPRSYTEEEYASELQRLYEAVSPLILRCKDLGRAIRIGVNHGSLSDRIMNRFGDTPDGMCESAMEFLRICEAHDFHDVVVSMKASNPRIMLEATRLMAARMDAAGLPYPLHLGVTEAGGGEDARIKSAIGIATMLRDGVGDTIRVSLTEDPVTEVPVALALAKEAEKLWAEAEKTPAGPDFQHDLADPFRYRRRESAEMAFGDDFKIGATALPRVVVRADFNVAKAAKALPKIRKWNEKNPRTRIEGLILTVKSAKDAAALADAVEILGGDVPFVVADISAKHKKLAEVLSSLPDALKGKPVIILCRATDKNLLAAARLCAERLDLRAVLDLTPAELAAILQLLKSSDTDRFIFTSSVSQVPLHPAGQYRLLVEMLRWAGIKSPVWIRHTEALMESVRGKSKTGDTARIMDAAVLAGGLLCDGVGDMISAETEPDFERSTAAAYSILQGARARSTRTEYIACPGCGRTLYDIEAAVKSIREATGHLQGVTIAVMGCIVNGPGEMADADFGYVGGAPGKVNLYVGKRLVEVNIPSENAVQKLVELIKSSGRWQEK
jgi:(E)-4-hydroxy-3-methylbut-2-enyl-diphosphate synthase